ncbi:MAG: hypothetical protein ACKN9W_04460 [Methylococcus sp.]
MHPLEFEATAQNHTDRPPKPPAAPDIKSLLASVTEGLSPDDLKGSPDSRRQLMYESTSSI